MSWLLPALLAPAIYAVNIFIDKYILGKEIKDYRGLPIFTGIIGFLFGLIFLMVFGMPTLGFFDIFLILLSGMLTLWGLSSYFKALTQIHASLVNLLMQTSPILILILSFLLFKQGISQRQILGFSLILTASIFGSMEGEKIKFKITKSFWLMMVSNIFFAFAAIIIKFTLGANAFTKIITFESFGVGIGSLVLFIFFSQIRKAFYKNIDKIKIRVFGLILFNEAIFVLAKALSYFAYSLGPVALVSIIGGTQVLYGFLYGWVLTLILPRVFRENISVSNLIKNLILAVLVFLGIWLVS